MDYSKGNQNWDSLSYVEKNHQLYLNKPEELSAVVNNALE